MIGGEKCDSPFLFSLFFFMALGSEALQITLAFRHQNLECISITTTRTTTLMMNFCAGRQVFLLK
jgi:hypothetical protein